MSSLCYHVIFLLISLFFSSCLCSYVALWPMPTKLVWPQPQAASLSPHFTIIPPPNHQHRHLKAAIDRYLGLVKSEHHLPLVNPEVEVPSSPATSELEVLEVQVADLVAPLEHGVDESYNLSIPTAGGSALLVAETPWGAMRGLETFSQLVWGANPTLVAVGLEIHDFPVYGHRGVMLDTSRNYYEVDDILRTIEAMSANKLNVFHWHITDSHSFPLVLPSEPSLAAKGSYGPFMQYTPADVTRIVEFGLDHGVRVIPEIDTPAHTGSWAGAHPEIVTCANMFWWPAGTEWEDRLASEPGTGQLNPLHPKTYQVVQNVIRDVLSLFPDNFYHGGGDEVIPGCWKTDSTIQSFLNSSKLDEKASLSQLLEKFINTTLPYIITQNRTAVYWEDVLLDATIRLEDKSVLPSQHTILQTWNGGPGNTKQIVSSGYRVIVSSADYYYLDCGHGGFVGSDSIYDQPPGTDQGSGGSWCNPFKTWQLIYNYDIAYGLTEDEKRLVLGGEVALWSEQADPTVLDSRLWPRASALAEALWSGSRDDEGKTKVAEATDRLNEWRHRMVNRGVGAEPIQPLWCVRNPGMCNAVHPAG
uniref:Beta-hexosaminidase n=1 Tax=Opuntia streptacantha TaxID=393608 RepID=A0A7C9A3N9_OPUST